MKEHWYKGRACSIYVAVNNFFLRPNDNAFLGVPCSKVNNGPPGKASMDGGQRGRSFWHV